MNPIFEIRALKQFYEGRCVLNIDRLSVVQGEILAIVGPSGAGKSTFLRLLNFLEMPTEGTIQFDHNIPDRPPSLDQKRRITTVFQHPIMLKRSVIANLKFGLEIHGKEIDHARIKTYLDRFGLTSLAHKHAHKLSAGEAQRVALARALLIQPDVILLDEPTANLDPYNIKLIERVVTEENKNSQTTVVIVTHNILQAQRISDRTALILDGKLVEITPTPVFFTNPENPQTIAFINGELVY